MTKFKKILAAALACCSLTVSSVSVLAEESNEYKFFDQLSNFIANTYIEDGYSKEDVMKMALSKYLQSNPEEMTKLLKAACDGLDEYSEFFTAQEYADYVNQINNAFYGIGVVINQRDGYVTVTRCIEGGGAEKAGIQAGDKIIRVDGEDVVGFSTEKVKNKIAGDLGTTVKVTVLRGETEKEFTVERAEVRDDTVSYSVLEDNIGYIRIVSFATTTDAEFEKALAYMDENGITKLILDMRDNPGGYLSSAVNIAGMLVPEGKIISTDFRQPEKNQVYVSELKETKYDLKVLVNENTASSSEILTSAIQDSGAGKVYGTQTFGKAVIQEMYRLSGGMAIKLTVGHYITRNGNEINKVGIEPDEYITNGKRMVDMSRYTKFDYQSSWAVGDTSDNIKAAEERLRGMGYNPGPVDGLFTEETQEAIRLFQAKMGLYDYGILDKTTQVRLENEFCQLQEEVDTQLQTAYTDFGGKAENLYK